MYTLYTFPGNELQRVDIDDSGVLGVFNDYLLSDVGLEKQQRLVYVFEKRNGYIVGVMPKRLVKSFFKDWIDDRYVFKGFVDKEIQYTRQRVKAAHFESEVTGWSIYGYTRIQYKDGKLEND